MRVAIVEAEPAAADLLTFVAHRRGHQPVCVPALDRLFERLPFEPQIAIISLPDLDAATLENVQRVRETFPEISILLITERWAALPPIAGLKAGAQDVIRSPYNLYEVMLRAESWAAARSVSAQAPTSGIKLADLEIDLDLFLSVKNGVTLPLTKLERRLLFCLCQHYPNVAPLERMLAFGWESIDEPDAALLKTHISHIRKKLRDAGGVPFEITSQQTIGYTLSIAEGEAKAS
ncbi:MAG: response regulator transcription factor [Hyphomicrobiales bacterium]